MPGQMKVERELLDKAIKLSDYSIKVICRKAGITTQSLHYYRKATYFPSVVIAVRLCNVLKLTVEQVWHD